MSVAGKAAHGLALSTNFERSAASGQLRLPINRLEYCDGPQLPDLATVQLALATALISILVPHPRKRGWFSEKHDLSAAV